MFTCGHIDLINHYMVVSECSISAHNYLCRVFLQIRFWWLLGPLSHIFPSSRAIFFFSAKKRSISLILYAIILNLASSASTIDNLPSWPIHFLAPTVYPPLGLRHLPWPIHFIAPTGHPPFDLHTYMAYFLHRTKQYIPLFRLWHLPSATYTYASSRQGYSPFAPPSPTISYVRLSTRLNDDNNNIIIIIRRNQVCSSRSLAHLMEIGITFPPIINGYAATAQDRRTHSHTEWFYDFFHLYISRHTQFFLKFLFCLLHPNVLHFILFFR